MPVGFSIQDEAMDVARSAPQGAHYHVDVIYLLHQLRIKNGALGFWYSKLSLHSLYPVGQQIFAFFNKVWGGLRVLINVGELGNEFLGFVEVSGQILRPV